jgi:hypothetical protein
MPPAFALVLPAVAVAQETLPAAVVIVVEGEALKEPAEVRARRSGLTRFDAAYLEAFYSLPPKAPALRLAGAVARA